MAEPGRIMIPRLRPPLSSWRLGWVGVCLGLLSIAILWGIACSISYCVFATPMLDQLS